LRGAGPRRHCGLATRRPPPWLCCAPLPATLASAPAKPSQTTPAALHIAPPRALYPLPHLSGGYPIGVPATRDTGRMRTNLSQGKNIYSLMLLYYGEKMNIRRTARKQTNMVHTGTSRPWCFCSVQKKITHYCRGVS
jgi:hypothetical protein